MSISSTLNEIYYHNPYLSVKELFHSGQNVGKDMMGTMSNTLILAFTGSSINTLIFIYAYDYPLLQIMNMYSIGIEIIQGLSLIHIYSKIIRINIRRFFYSFYNVLSINTQ